MNLPILKKNILFPTLLLLLIPVFQSTVYPQTPDFTVEQVLSSPFPTSLTASPEGQRIAWVFNHNGKTNIWFAEAPEFKGKQLTDYKTDDSKGLRIWGFIEQGKAILFSKNGRFNLDHSPDWNGKSTLFKLNCNDGKMEKLARTYLPVVPSTTGQLAYSRGGDLYIFAPGEKPEKRISTRGILNNLQWSPDGKRIVMESRRGTFPHEYYFIMVHDTEKNTTRYIDASIYEDSRPTWSPDSKRIAFIRRLTHGHLFTTTARKYPVPDPWELRIADANTRKARSVWKSPPSDSLLYVRIAWLDNQNVAFISEADGWRHLYAVPATGGEPRQLTKGKFIVEQFKAVPAMKKIFFNSNANDIDRRHIWSVSIDGKMKQETKGDGIEWAPVPLGNDKYLAWTGSSAVSPAEVYVKPLKGGETIKPAKEILLKDFPKQLTVPRQVILKAADGWKIHAQLFLPPKSFKGKRPAVMFFHGGPIRQMLLGFHYSLYYHKCYAINQYLASRGFVVLSVNYRLSIGYGKAFRDVPDGGPRGCSEYRDLLAGAKYLRGMDTVDSSRIGLWGGSYGGTMTALGLARNSDLFAAGADLNGVHDWNEWGAWVTGRKNTNDRTTWRSSPIADVRDWRSPVLLVHSDDDRNVAFSETIKLADKLTKQGVEHELIILPDDVHNYLLHSNWVKAFKAAASFLERKLMK